MDWTSCTAPDPKKVADWNADPLTAPSGTAWHSLPEYVSASCDASCGGARGDQLILAVSK